MIDVGAIIAATAKSAGLALFSSAIISVESVTTSLDSISAVSAKVATSTLN